MELKERVENLINRQFDLILDKVQEDLSENGYDFLELEKIKNLLLIKIQDYILENYDSNVKVSVKLGEDNKTSPVFIGKVYVFLALKNLLNDFIEILKNDLNKELEKVSKWSFRYFRKKFRLDIDNLSLVSEKDILMRKKAELEKIFEYAEKILQKDNEELNIILKKLEGAHSFVDKTVFEIIFFILSSEENRKYIKKIIDIKEITPKKILQLKQEIIDLPDKLWLFNLVKFKENLYIINQFLKKGGEINEHLTYNG